jgi:hypothetical protein
VAGASRRRERAWLQPTHTKPFQPKDELSKPTEVKTLAKVASRIATLRLAVASHR